MIGQGSGGASMATPLPKRIPEVSFARIMVVVRDAQAAAAWPRPLPAIDGGPAVKDGMFLRRNSALRKCLKINTRLFLQKL
jgi:hypothetical protein